MTDSINLTQEQVKALQIVMCAAIEWWDFVERNASLIDENMEIDGYAQTEEDVLRESLWKLSKSISTTNDMDLDMAVRERLLK